MSLKNHYHYDEERCEFIPIEYKRAEQIVYNLSIWILTGVIMAGLGITFLSNTVGTPAELALKAENETLYQQLNDTRSSLDELGNELSRIAYRDNEMYRSILGMEKLSLEEREAGVGGTDMYEEFDIHSAPTADLLKWTSSKIDGLERKMSIQRMSFDELKTRYNQHSDKIKHIPAIKPTPGIMLSPFGLRLHPILEYEKQHNGADFRADLGAPIYSTADGTVTFTGRRGTLGRVVEIDHGYGYKTLYAHLSQFEKGIKKGTKVIRGQQIAKAGSSGLVESTGLHYEVHFNNQPVDPSYYIFADISLEEYLMFKEMSLANSKALD
ncbi:MAG: M23 family metallopeptidase [Bacteroidota bacterium]